MDGLLREIAIFLRQLGAGPGADPANAVPRFVIPAVFWAALAAVALLRHRRVREPRDLLLGAAALVGLARELLMLTVEYGSHRGLLSFRAVAPYYPPLEHFLELAVQVVSAYALLASMRGPGRLVRAYLWLGLGAAALCYVVVAPAWAAFAARALPAAGTGGPRVELAQHWGDLAMRLVAVAALLPVVPALLALRRRGAAPRMAALAFLFFLLDHALMLVSILGEMRHAWILSPLRHNLHMWAVPMLLAVYWLERAEEVRRGQEQLQLVLEGSSEGFWDWDLVTRALQVSARGASLLGLEAAPPAGRAGAWRALIHPEDLSPVDEAGRALVRGPDAPAHLQFRMRARDGSWHWMEVRGRVVARSRAGRALRAAGTLRDVTEARQAAEAQRELEARVLQGQKLESLGLLAGGVAHDFNNLLTIVRGNLAAALRELPPGEPREALEEAQTGTQRAVELAAQLLAYAGRGETHAEPLHLSRLAAETAALVRSSLPAGCRLVLQCPDDLPRCQADPTQLRQVLMNLLLNASQAMQGRRGDVVVRAGLHEHSGDPLESSPFSRPPAPGTYVWVEVADQGGGMDPETRARIFDPFFTTRAGGRGLGLSVVLGIVRGHQGALTVRSEPGRGSAFRFYLPVTASQASERTPAPLPIAPVVALRPRR